MRLKSILFLVVSIAALSGCSDPGSQQRTDQGGPIPAPVTTPEIYNGRIYTQYTGRFDAVQRVDIRARVSGEIVGINFDDGQLVDKGAVLFQIDPEPFEIAVRQTRAQFEIAEREFERAQQLRRNGNMSGEVFEERAAQVAIRKAAFEDASLSLGYTSIKAPFAGRVSRNRVDVGALISGGSAGGTLLTTLVSVEPIHFYFQGTEQDVLRYSRRFIEDGDDGSRGVGIPVEIRLEDETSFEHKGTIDFVDNQISFETGTKSVRAIVPQTRGILEPGMFGTLRVAAADTTPKLTVPGNVILSEQTLKYVLTLTPDNRVARTYVTLGPVVEGNRQVVLSGLERETRVLAGRLQILQPGMPVQPVALPAAGRDGM